jgi:hypothetical protein
MVAAGENPFLRDWHLLMAAKIRTFTWKIVHTNRQVS